LDASDQVWIFAYGSLMWRPGFAYAEAAPTRLHGYHRSLCIYSIVHRGTPEQPGLVLGLDRGGSCRGWAFRVDPERQAEILDYLDSRELVTDVYRRKRLPVTVGGRRVVAWGYVVRREHPQYAGQLAPDRLLDLVRRGAGRSGRCRDYLLSTVSHLEAMGIVDGPLHVLAKTLLAAGTEPAHASPIAMGSGGT
jgi:glutathione-specific gamma-glutamylcyclotransferase